MSTRGPKDWRNRSAQGQGAGKLVLRRVVFSILALGLIGVLASIVWNFGGSQPRLAILTVDNYETGAIPAIPCANGDKAALQSLDENAEVLDQSQSSVAMGALEQRINEVLKNKEDTLFLYLSAHGVTGTDGKPYLLCSDFQLPSAGRLPVGTLITQIAACEARRKLLVLDTSHLPPDSRLGSMLNEFADLVHEQVAGCGDPDLWVLLSCDSFETAQVWPSEGLSVFGHFVSEGIRGKANVDGDKIIDIDELASYVQKNVSGFVQKYYGGSITQSPVLLAGTKGRVVSAPKGLELLSVATPPEPADEESDEGQGDKEGDEEGDEEEKKTTDEDRPEGKKAESAAVKRPGFLAMIGPQQPKEKTDATAKDEATAKGSAEQAQPKGDAAKNPAPSGAQPQPPAEPEAKPEAQQPAPDVPAPLLALYKAWVIRDQLDQRDRQPSPVDYAPHYYRRFQDMLLRYEHRYLYGTLDAAELEAALAADVAPAKALLEAPLKRPEDLSNIIDRIAAAAPQPIPAGTPAYSLAFEKMLIRDAGAKDLQANLNALGSELDRVTQQSFENLDLRKDQVSEIHFAQSLKDLTQLSPPPSWELIQSALSCRIKSERVVAFAPWATDWISGGRLNEADRRRLSAERKIFRKEVSDQLVNEFRRANRLFDEIYLDLSIIKRGIDLRSDLLFRSPYYLKWYASAGKDPANNTPPFDSIEDLLELLPDLLNSLADPRPGPDVARRINAKILDLESSRKSIEESLQKAFVEDLIDDINLPGKVPAALALLSTPLMRARERVLLLDALQNKLDPRLAAYEPQVMPKKQADFDLHWKRVTQQAALEKSLIDLTKLSSGGFTGLSAVTGSKSDRLKAARAFSKNLSAAYVDIANQLRSWNDEGDSNDAQLLATLDTSIRLLDAREALEVGDRSPIERFRLVQLHQLLAFEAKRLAAARAGSSVAEYERLTLAARGYTDLADKIPDRARLPYVESRSKQWNFPNKSPERIFVPRRGITYELVVTGLSSVTGSLDSRLEVRYDDSKVKLVYRGESVKTDSWSLTTGPNKRRFNIQLRDDFVPSRQNKSDIVFTVHEGDFFESFVVPLALPTPDPLELAVQSDIPGMFSSDGDQILLTPFPQGINVYRFYLENVSEEPKTVQVELRSSPPDPRGDRVITASSGKLLARLAEPMQIPAGEKPQIRLPARKTAEGESAPGIDHGFYFVLRVAGESPLIRRVKIAPLRPRDYIRPKVSYTPGAGETGKINVSVERMNPDMFPETGTQIALEVTDGRQSVFFDDIQESAEIKPQPNPDLRGRLYLSVRENSHVEFSLTVDGYPRALNYVVECNRPQNDILYRRDVGGITILQPNPRENEFPKQASLNVLLKVDAPYEAWRSGKDFLRVGVIQDGQGDFNGDFEHEFYSDRQHRITLPEIGPAGAFHTNVVTQDYRLSLDVAGKAGPREVLAQLRTRIVQKDASIRIKLDGTEPTLRVTDAGKGAVKVGDVYKVKVRAEEDLTRVKEIEAIFETDVTSQGWPGDKIIRRDVGVRDIYTLNLDTKELATGITHTLLVRARNTVGMASDPPSKIQFRVSPAAVVVDPGDMKKMTGIRGRALNQNGEPFNKAKVVLYKDFDASKKNNKPVAAKQVDQTGEYEFLELEPGNYTLIASGRLGTRGRAGRQEAVVTEGKIDTWDVTLSLRAQ